MAAANLSEENWAGVIELNRDRDGDEESSSDGKANGPTHNIEETFHRAEDGGVQPHERFGSKPGDSDRMATER
jgi:hypothetical protein